MRLSLAEYVALKRADEQSRTGWRLDCPERCVERGCGGRIHGRGLCKRHYVRQLRRLGPVRRMGRTLAPLA